MLQSLRARLAFLFAGTLVLATVIASVVVVSLYQSYNRDQTEAALRKQVEGVASYYQGAFCGTFGKAGPAARKITDARVRAASATPSSTTPGRGCSRCRARDDLKTVVPDLNPGSLSRSRRVPCTQFMRPERAPPTSASARRS